MYRSKRWENEPLRLCRGQLVPFATTFRAMTVYDCEPRTSCTCHKAFTARMPHMNKDKPAHCARRCLVLVEKI